jgi:aarF domain-containing kinase
VVNKIDDNFIHADLHPGNMLVRVGPVSRVLPPSDAMNTADVSDEIIAALKGTTPLPPPDPVPLTLVLLDCGLVTSLSPKDRANFLSLFGALAQGDGRMVSYLFMSTTQ